MRRTLIGCLLLIGAVSCAAPTPSTPAATSTPSAPAPTSTQLPKATPEPSPTAPGALPAAPPLAAGADSALLFGYRASHNELRRVDLATGGIWPGTEPLDAGEYSVYDLSPDGSQLALFNYPRAENAKDGTLELIDTRTLRSRTIEGISFPTVVNSVHFSPDGQRLAVAFVVTETGSFDSQVTGFSVALIDLVKGALIGQTSLDFSPDTLHFSADGKSIMVYGTRYGILGTPEPSVPHVALFDAADLRMVWTSTVDGLLDGWYPLEETPTPYPYEGIQWTPAPIFSADGAKLYLVHADIDKLTTVDFGKRSMATMDIGPKLSFFDRLMGLGAGVAHAKALRGSMLSGVLCADGKSLAVVGTHMDFSTDSSGQFETTNTSLNLRIIDAETGALIRTIDTPATTLSAQDDAGNLFLHRYDPLGTPTTDILDMHTFDQSASVPGWDVSSLGMTLADGRRALMVTRWGNDGSSTLGIVDADNFGLIASWHENDSWGWVLPSQ